MAKKAASKNGKKQKSKKQEPEMETDVILIVKGAGEQTEDEHLSIFLGGFWPAVKSLDKDATIVQVSEGFDDLKPSPHNTDGESHKHVTEIHATHQFKEKIGQTVTVRKTKRRILLKESYWENEVLSSGALGNLSKEWRMASFVFANMLRNVVFSRNTRALKNDMLKGNTRFQLWRSPGVRRWDFFGYYASYFSLFFLVFLPFYNSFPSIAGQSGLVSVILVSLVLALAPTVEHSAGVYRWLEEDKKGIFRRLPGLPGWVLFALIFLLVSSPLEYIKGVAFVLGLQIALIVARSLLWNQRTYANSDVDIAEYYSYFENGDITRKRFGKVDELGGTRVFFTPLLYRYLIFLTLPIAFAGTLLASLFKWTRFLGGIGETIDKFLNILLVGYMDDVVNYANNPAQAHRVRSAVLYDLAYFYNKPGVKRIHVVAHSQGTPITYETLFYFLDKKYQRKVLTYLTLGSVLSYYHQARGVLDAVYFERFPVPATRKQNFPEDFKWMNFWNFADPITEFYGLDEYSEFEKAPPLDEKFDRTRTSPTNIRTRTSLANHGEYWNNIEKFTLPLAKRVMGELRPEEWAPDVKRDEETKDTKQLDLKHYRHHIAVVILWSFIVAGVIFLNRWLPSWLPDTGLYHQLSEYFSQLNSSALAVYQHYNLPDLSASKPEQLNMLWKHILNGSLFVIVLLVLVDLGMQVLRIIRIFTQK